MTHVRFVGGTEDGKTREVDVLARTFIVLKRKETGTAEEFKKIDLDVVYGHKQRQVYSAKQIYKLTRQDNADTGEREYAYVLESEEAL